MANNRPQGKEEISLNTCVLPENFADTGRCFNGMFRTRNLIEGVIMAGPIAYFTVHLNLPISQKAFVTAIFAGGVLFACLNGINGDSLTEFIMHWILYVKHKRVAKYNPRVKVEAKPGYLTKESRELPREKIARLIGEFQNRKGVQETVSSEIYDPIYKEFFEDDLGVVETPAGLKTRSERRRDARNKKREERAKRREEKQQAQKAKKEKKAAERAARKMKRGGK